MTGDAVRQRLAAISERADVLDEVLANECDADCGPMCPAGSATAVDARRLVAALTAVLDRHRLEPLYEPCGHSNGLIGTAAEHAWETVQGEWVCGPPVAAVCSTCRDEDGSRIDYPCDEVRAVVTALEEPS